jgi:hypothetical protein
MSKKNKDKQKKEGATYDPSKVYQWDPNEKFEMSGRELEYIFRATIDFLGRPESQHVLKAREVHKLLEQKIREGVEKGNIIEKS